MPATWLYIIGGLILAAIVFTIAFNSMSQVIASSERQTALNQFSNLATDIEAVCLQEINNSDTKTYSVPFSVRVIYTANNIVCRTDAECDTGNICVNNNCLLSAVIDKIKNQKISSGNSICFQFKDEQYPRCKKSLCQVSVPYIGALPESEDIWQMINKILGKSKIREYELEIRKIGGREVIASMR